ncbi:hypothetical protein L226DRAFT_609610 [Lentinus tigrinus ALCF2SS1-7]|uniref:Uncharacterized protein n=1 Tax=Lentinus tigrinus ALCF2SS1-6 TaxID=1328759 RepID=A0A5C2SNZ8_9APHY|nr:hypothetical protein L227DRAFT_570854 [Lentinus tigrinus ALCF2SS1-6]RPD79056.1 hypothetical protein L226DRAFT_609610 [Lentinus tigrinus ALCF2SS1-7]
MSSVVNKIKSKTTGKSSQPQCQSKPEQQNQPTFNILPHPAKKNDPRDFEPPQFQRKPQQQSQPTFSILPHPAKTNDPRDLEPPQPGGGLNSKPEFQAFHARDPYVPSPQIANNLPPPKSREELRARAQELNQKQ